MNKISEFYKYANYYLAKFIKSAAPYRDNTVPEGSVLESNINARLGKTDSPVMTTLAREIIRRANMEDIENNPNLDAAGKQQQISQLDQLIETDPFKVKRPNQLKYIPEASAQRYNAYLSNGVTHQSPSRIERKKIYQAMQPRPGQAARDYQKAQTENYNNMVQNVINGLESVKANQEWQEANKSRIMNRIKNWFMTRLGIKQNTLADDATNIALENARKSNNVFRDTNRAYRTAESERQLLLEQIPENHRDFIANTKIKIVPKNSTEIDPGFAGVYQGHHGRMILRDYGNGQIMPHVGIHEGLHGVTEAQPNTPMNNAMVNQYSQNSMTPVNVNGKQIPQAQLALKNELRSINGTERIVDQNAELLPANQQEKYRAAGRDDHYKRKLFRGAGLKHVPEIRKRPYYTYADINKLTDKIVRGKGINVNKILNVEPADTEWNNTYNTGFGKRGRTDPNSVNAEMEAETKNYRMQPTGTGMKRWNRAHKKSSILDNVEIALEKNKEKKDLLDWYRDNRENINYQYGVAKAVDRHERKAKRKKLERPVWEARRRSFGKTAGYYPLLLHKYIYK